MGKNNLALLNAIIEEYTEQNFPEGESKDTIFEQFVTESYFKKYDLSDEEITKGLVGGKIDWGIDGFFIIIDGKIVSTVEDLPSELNRNFRIDLYIFQYKNTESFDENVINKFITVAPYVSDIDMKEDCLENSISQDIIDAISLFHSIIIKYASKFPKVKITFIHATRGDTENINGNNIFNKPYNQKIANLKQMVESANLGGETLFAYDLIGAEELKDLTQYQKSYSGSLKLNENPIFVEYGQEENKQKGYIATAFVKDYFEFLVDYDNEHNAIIKDYLFESNIRDYQNRTEVNKEIEDTLKNKKKDKDFWWLNNGITILADEGSLVGKTFSLENIQIVNGLQTSYSIYNSLKEDNHLSDENRTIFCKIIITKEEETRDSIIKATNSQNTVPPSSLRSTDTIQRDIEAFFYKNGLFYDRRKNYYKNLKKPRNKIITINYLAQTLTAILQSNPSKARSNPTVLTKKDDDYKLLFNEHINIEVYYYAVLLRKQMEEYLKNSFQTKDALDEDINKYLKLHLTRILASLLVHSSKVTAKDLTRLKEEDIRNIDDDIFGKSIDILKDTLTEQMGQKKNQRVANFSKSETLSKVIDDKLRSLPNL